ncbi:MAG: Na+/H+ antiporter subunit E [Oscillospiraceae bacterium]|nr:Na+/H+ antiporter subunit E [Oscillospiraceae bacterium]MBQ4102697.1 Na+/H+ antiporter subunit E [Oscillospiraceae bacterium]
MAVFLFLFWILLNGRLTLDAGMLQIVVTGLVVSFSVTLFARKALGFTKTAEKRLFGRIFALIGYVLVLIWEILKANFAMIRVILTGKKRISPVIVRVKIPLKTNFCRVILANSITLTPGTITAELEGDWFTVHCIDRAFAEGLEESVFVKLLERMER